MQLKDDMSSKISEREKREKKIYQMSRHICCIQRNKTEEKKLNGDKILTFDNKTDYQAVRKKGKEEMDKSRNSNLPLLEGIGRLEVTKAKWRRVLNTLVSIKAK